MADRLIRLFKTVVFRAAFAGFIVVEFVLFVLLLWALSEIAPDPSYFLLGIFIVLTLLGPFLIGACSYLIFQRMTRGEYVVSESERWLAERHGADACRTKHRKATSMALWIPSLAVLMFCLFLDRTWPPLSHLLHPSYGRLGAYRVSMPLDWSVIFSEPDTEGNQRRSYVRANHWKGVLKSGIDEFTGMRPSLTSSSAGCDSSRLEEEHPNVSPLSDRDRLAATRKFSQGNVSLVCEEFVSRDPRSAKESRTVSCVAVERDFDCALYEADERDVQEFYDMVQQIRKVK